MPTWPGSLPQNLEFTDYEEISPEVTIQTQMDAGPPKSRRRFTAGIEPIKGRQLLTSAQVATLETFFRTTLSGGALNFDWVHPRTQAVATMRFVKPPRKQAVGPATFYAHYELIILP